MEQCLKNLLEMQELTDIISCVILMHMRNSSPGLYSQVVMTLQKGYDNKKEKEKTKKYNLQGQSARSIRWFDLDDEWLEEIFRTHEPDFY